MIRRFRPPAIRVLIDTCGPARMPDGWRLEQGMGVRNGPKHCSSKAPRYPQKNIPRRSKLDHSAIIKILLITESSVKVGDSKYQIKPAVKKL
ncbi:hypothetical protein J0S82_007214 [Galemys pyrenaicus]|uniref:Uncharacterized protein n=1 Tax=Galemys pyrenaicus TaxID=202257 RepID=A0A8J6ABV1_GALPY|nr:hypothetical protein J0S82_007214 [Galemys pyrenaicus]